MITGALTRSFAGCGLVADLAVHDALEPADITRSTARRMAGMNGRRAPLTPYYVRPVSSGF